MTPDEKDELLHALEVVRGSAYLCEEFENGNYSSAWSFLDECARDLETTSFEPVAVSIYSHTDHDEDSDHLVEEFMKRGVPAPIAEGFLLNNPLYEVEFEYHINPGTGEATCVKVHGMEGGTAYNLSAMQLYTFEGPGLGLPSHTVVLATNEDAAWELAYNHLSTESLRRERAVFTMTVRDFDPVVHFWDGCY